MGMCDYGRQTMRYIIVIFAIAILLVSFAAASAQRFDTAQRALPPEIRIDSRLVQVEQAVRDSNLVRARALLEDVLRLREQHQVELPHSFHFWSAKVGDSPVKVIASATAYVTEAGRDGRYYFEALEIMNEATNTMCEGWNTDEYFKAVSFEDVTICLEFGKSPAARSEDNATVLHRAAAFNGEPRVIRALIAAGGDINALDANDETPLHRAAAANTNTGVVRFLVEAGADPIARDKDNETPVFEAVRSNPNAEVVGYLLMASGYTARAAGCKAWNTDEYFRTVTPEEVTTCIDIGANPTAPDGEKRSPLHRASRHANNPCVVEVLLKAGGEPDERDKDDWTPLHLAAGNNENPAVVEVLLKAGADLNARNSADLTSLHLAAGLNRNPAVVEVLLEGGAEPNAMDKARQKPLHLAAKANANPDVVTVLLKAGADLQAKDKDEWTSMHFAALNKSATVAKVLLKAGADVNARGNDSLTPLHVAAGLNRNPDVVEVLLKAGAEIKSKDKKKRRPLHIAAEKNGNPDVVTMLLKAGADLQAKDKDKWMPLHFAAFNKNPAIAKVLLSNVSDPEKSLKKRTKDNFMPLHYAAGFNENPDVIRVLLDAGADLNATDHRRLSLSSIAYMWTPLHYAARNNNNPAVLKVLLDAGADPNRRSIHGTALHLAAVNTDSPAVLKVLLDAGADLEGKWKGLGDHERPLHLAARHARNPAVVRFLLNAGANLHPSDKDKRTPIHYAALNKNPEITRVLLEAGAGHSPRDKDSRTPMDIAEEERNFPVTELLAAAGAERPVTALASDEKKGTDWTKLAVGVLGGAAIVHAGKDSPSEITEQALADWINVMTESDHSSDAPTALDATSPQSQGEPARDQMQQAIQNLERICGEKYRSGFAANDHARFYCLAAFNDHCALKRAQTEEAKGKLRASLAQNCSVLVGQGLSGKCTYCQ